MLTLQPVPDAPRRRHEWLFPLAAFPRRCRHCLRLENELIVCANQEVGWCDGVAPAPSPTPTEIQRLAQRLAFAIAPYPSERESVARLLTAFADEIVRRASEP